MEEYYRKVEIKSEADLPKEDGEYFVHYKAYGMGSTHYYEQNHARIFTWLDKIDWYLQPIPQPKGLSKDEIMKILNKYKDFTMSSRIVRETIASELSGNLKDEDKQEEEK